MDTQDLQHIDDLEKQERLLSILGDIWFDCEITQDDIYFMAGALGLFNEFNDLLKSSYEDLSNE